jgi:hypothetical protein
VEAAGNGRPGERDFMPLLNAFAQLLAAIAERARLMPRQKSTLLVSCALAALGLLMMSAPALAQGSVTPSFGDGELTLSGAGYRPGERVEITIRIADGSHQFTARADGRGRFRLETGLGVQPFSSLEIEARDEQGLTQVSITTVPGFMPLQPAEATPAVPTPPTARVPSQLPGTGGHAERGFLALLAAGGTVLLAGTGLLMHQASPPHP